MPHVLLFYWTLTYSQGHLQPMFSRNPLPISRAAWAPGTQESLSIHPFHSAFLQVRGVLYTGAIDIASGRSWRSCSWVWLDASGGPQNLTWRSELWVTNSSIETLSGHCLIVPWQRWGSNHFCVGPKCEYSFLRSWVCMVGLTVVCDLLA